MADREQARARSDATARALKGSLSSELGKGLVFSYMPSAGQKVTGKQKAVGGCSPCLASSFPAVAPLPPVLLILPIHPGCLQRGEHLQGARSASQHHLLVAGLWKLTQPPPSLLLLSHPDLPKLREVICHCPSPSPRWRLQWSL